MALPPVEKVPAVHCMQPSVLCVAPVKVALDPASQFMLVQVTTAPPVDYDPFAQVTHPC